MAFLRKVFKNTTGRIARPISSTVNAISKPRRVPQRSTSPPSRNWLNVMPPARMVTTQPACISFSEMDSTQKMTR